MTATALHWHSRQTTKEERDIRVEDYLNDKLQTYADLENLDALLESVKAQQGLLRQQVCLRTLTGEKKTVNSDLA